MPGRRRSRSGPGRARRRRRPPLGRRRFGRDALRPQSTEELRGQSGVDGQGGPLEAVLERLDRSRRQERRPRVEQHDVAPRPGLAAKHGLHVSSVRGRVATGELRGRGRSQAERLGIDEPLLDAVLGHVVHHARAVERQLVDPGAVDHQRPLRAESMDHLREPPGRSRVADAEQLATGAGRVGEWPEQVERRPDPDLLPGRAGVAHGRMERRREQEREPEFGEGGRGRRGVVVDADAERVEHVRRACLRGDRPIAVLRDRHARPPQRRARRPSRC